MRIISSGPTISEADIQELEAKLGSPLPNDYRIFLLTYNAHEIMPCVFPTPNFIHSEKVVLRELTCFWPNTSNNFDWQIKVYDGRIPNGMLPIGSDPGGNIFLLDLNNNTYGEVCFWERAYEVEEGELPTRDNVFVIAMCFANLLANLVDE